MEPIFVGWLSLLPPLLAISLALITKEVMSSLLIGILSGSLIYACASGLNPFMGTLTTTFDLMASRVDMKILIFLGLLGALVVVVTMAGGSRAYGRWVSDKIKNRHMAQLATAALGILIFIDDYFNCLTVGTVMKPLTDKHNIPRAKLAYIIDATAARYVSLPRFPAGQPLSALLWQPPVNLPVISQPLWQRSLTTYMPFFLY